MEQVRLMCWCRSCVGGMHLPAFAASAAGLFAEQGLEVEFVNAAPFPDMTLQGLSARVKAVAAGEADFALTSIAFLLSAQTEAGGELPARFAAVAHQRNPIVAVVREDSDIREPADLVAARAARWSIPWFTQEYVGALAHMGLGRATVVETPGDLNRALGEGEIDVIPTWREMTLYHLDAGFPIRIIPLDLPVYTTGLLAADHVSPELAARMRDAFVAGYDLQRENPEPGIAAFRRRFPSISDVHIRANWALFEPYAFDGVPPGSMDADRWQVTIDYTAATHGVSAYPAGTVYREELLTPALATAAA